MELVNVHFLPTTKDIPLTGNHSFNQIVGLNKKSGFPHAEEFDTLEIAWAEIARAKARASVSPQQARDLYHYNVLQFTWSLQGILLRPHREHHLLRNQFSRQCTGIMTMPLSYTLFNFWCLLQSTMNTFQQCFSISSKESLLLLISDRCNSSVDHFWSHSSDSGSSTKAYLALLALCTPLATKNVPLARSLRLLIRGGAGAGWAPTARLQKINPQFRCNFLKYIVLKSKELEMCPLVCRNLVQC